MKKAAHFIACFSVISLGNCITAQAQTPAFPGALGFGATATGGRNGTVYHVTTLADSGTGSFRDAVSHSGRIVIFDVGGYINLLSPVSCANNLTIAGQTAPGDGIGIAMHEVSFSARSNEIVRYVRFRPDSTSAMEDGINVGDGTNMIFDHISIEYGPYNNIDAHGNNGSDAITVQNSIIADPSYDGTSAKQGFGAHTEHLGGTFSWYYNLWVNEHNRQPLAKIDTIFVNNTVYNFEDGYTVANTSGHFRHDIINNYFVAGPADPSGGSAFFQMNANQSIYSTNNLLDNNQDGALNGSPIDPGGGGTVLTSPWSPLSTNLIVFSTAGAWHYGVSWAGVQPRDQVDTLVISQMKTLGNAPTGTGAGTAGPDNNFYLSQTQTGLGNNGYGTINGGIPAIDSDGDGMPDYWELTVGLNPNVNDAMTIAADGYANIEHYLNWLADPHALTATNTSVDVDLWRYTSGFTNASPVHSVNHASNGTVALNGDGHTAHFTPALNFFGLGSFQFDVTASDGSGYTNTVVVAVVPQSQSQSQPSYLTWVGDGTANLWAIGSGTNWFDGTNLVAFDTGDTVTFDDTGTNTPAINLSGALSAGTVYVLAEQDYTFGGSGFLAGPTALVKTGSGQLNINTTNNYSGGTLINEGVVQVGDGLNFSGSIGGNITNNDTLIFNNPGPVSSSASISGSGTLLKSAAGALVLSGTQTYTNLTTINAGSLQFSGAPPSSDVVDNGTLILAPGSFTVFNNTVSGSGNLANSGSALIYLTSANTFTGGITNNSGNLVLSNNAAAGSGPVIYNGGAVLVGGGIVITNDFSVPSAATDLMMQGTNGLGIWAGNIVNLGSGAQWRPGADTGGQFEFTGNALLGGRFFIVPRGTVVIASNAVVTTTQTGCALGRDTTGGNRSANVTIRDNASVTLGACSLGGGQAGGNITVTVQSSAMLNCGTNLDLNNVNRATAQTFLRLNGGTLITGGFTKTKASQTNSIAFNGGAVKANMNNTAFLPAFNFATNAVQAGGAIIDDGGFAITIAATLTHDPALGATSDGGLTKLGAGTLTLSGSSSYSGPTLINAGTLALVGTGLPATSDIILAPGTMFDVHGTINNGNFTFGGTGSLSGSGTCFGLLTFTNGAVLSPGGNSFGSLTFTNFYPSAAVNLMLKTGCTNVFKISHSPLTNDVAKIYGRVALNGTLIVTSAGLSQLAAGDTFKLFDSTNYSGAFSSVQLPPLPFGLVWNTDNLNSAGTISVALNTTPVIGSISISGGALGLSGTGGVGSAKFYVLSSTNLSLTPSNWTRLLTNQFDGSGNFDVTNAVDLTLPQDFYLLQLP